MECDITFEKPVLKDLEEIARLLSSPLIPQHYSLTLFISA